MCFPLLVAGFFAKSQIIFFSSIIIPILPTAQEWRQEWIAFTRGGKCFLPKKEWIGNASCPRLSGKVSTVRLTKGASVSRKGKQFLTKRYYIPACHSWTKENAVGNIVIKKYGEERRIRAEDTGIKCSNLCTYTRPYRLASSALPSEFGGSERKGKEWVSTKKFIRNGIKYLPVILERSEESGQRMWVLNAFSDILCRILR